MCAEVKSFIGILLPLMVTLFSYVDDRGFQIASDVIRFVFTPLPILPFTNALVILITAQEGNSYCPDLVSDLTLESRCAKFEEYPETLIYPANWKVAACCSAEYLSEEAAEKLTFCGKTFFEVPLPDNSTYEVQIPCFEPLPIFSWDTRKGINLDIFLILIDIILFCGLIVVIDMGLVARLRVWMAEKAKKVSPGEAPAWDEGDIDDDVVRERERIGNRLSVRHSTKDENILLVRDLEKQFKDLKAVDRLNFGVKRGECFGLLGVNGAGKTTTFRMLTGDEIIGGGSARLMGNDLQRNRKAFLQKIGYCPQFNSIVEVMTGREMLRLFGYLRGIPRSDIETEADRWLDFLGIQKYADRQCGTYSGGNKRKLNVAQALMGDPTVIFLDEPSAGVDPAARRMLWNVIGKITKNGQAVVLTSHRYLRFV